MDLREKFKEEMGADVVVTYNAPRKKGVNPDYLNWLEAKAGQHETIVKRRVFSEQEMKEAYEFAQTALLPTGHGKGWEDYKKMKGL